MLELEIFFLNDVGLVLALFLLPISYTLIKNERGNR